VRMEDLDKPRERPGAADLILRTLERFGFEWDGDVMYQSRRTVAYAAALARLQTTDTVFGCGCTRRDSVCLCRSGRRPPRAWRIAAPRDRVCFEDRLQGEHCEQLDDFVVLRADGYYAYQLAVVVDDAEQGITDVVRGADLLDSTPRQVYLQTLLGFPAPRYLHIPVAVNEAGEKLSKQTLAAPVDAAAVESTIRRALAFLGQAECDSLDEAVQHWSPARIPPSRRRETPAD
jgi:glutamyl-Q tRNA(Asp) synthetase